MEHSLFFDTNALLILQELAFENMFYISQKTLEEIENIKTSSNKDNEIKYSARKLAHLLIENENKYRVIETDKNIYDIINKLNVDVTPDNIILASAYYVNEWYENNNLIVCTNDLNCRFISKNIFKLNTKSIEELGFDDVNEDYVGYKDLTLSDEDMSYFYLNIDKNIYNCKINEYLIIRKSDGEIVDTYKWTGTEYYKVPKSRNIKSTYFDKLKPKDIYQACAIDSLLNNTITAISGKAGSGKSLLSLMVAMSLIESGKYDRLVILFNPTKAKGASDMGFYGGDFGDKAMQNSIGHILTTKFGDRYAIDLLLSNEKLKLVSMADCRGMEIRDNEILYITEAQNTSVELMKLCLSRVSSGAKVIVEGDYQTQVDSYLFNGSANGLKKVIDAFKDHEEFGYIKLKNVWRSKIAELCELLL